MSYFVTGATGFVGKFLIEKLLQRKGNIYVLIRAQSTEKLDRLKQRFPTAAERIIPVYGDLTLPSICLWCAQL